MRALFETLGLGPDATPDEVRRAYRRLALRCHPDLHVGDRAAHERFVRLSRAYRAVMDYLGHAEPGRFGACSSCASTARLYRWVDGRDCCGDCLLNGARRLLPHPAMRLVRFHGVMALWAAATALFGRGILTAEAAWHAGAIGCTLLGGLWLAVTTVCVSWLYDPAMPTSVSTDGGAAGRRQRSVRRRAGRWSRHRQAYPAGQAA